MTEGAALKTAIMLTWVTTAGDAYRFQTISNPARVILSGDYIEYDVWIDDQFAVLPTSFSDGGMILGYSDATTSDSGTPLADADGYRLFVPSTAFDALARGQWKARRAAMKAVDFGKTCNSVNVGGHSDTVGLHRCFFRNIRFTDGAGTTRQTVYASGEPTTSASYITNLATGVVCAGVGIIKVTRSGTTTTIVTPTAHSLTDGDPVKIDGLTMQEYNGIHQVAYLTTTTFTIEIDGSPTSPASGIAYVFPYTESYFKFTKYGNYQGANLLLHESNGHLYQILSDRYRDATTPINVHTRSVRMDGGSNNRKKMPSIRVIADDVPSRMMVRWSDDDCQTFSVYRVVNLDDEDPELLRCGAFKRRSLETRHVENDPIQLSALELEIAQ
jgi:hypothetical protein